MDKDELIKSITLDEMKSLLTELGAQQINDIEDKQFLITNTICHNISDGKLKLYYYYGEDKYFHCYTACQKNYNIIDLVIANFSLRGVVMSFTESIAWICRKLGKKFSYEKQDGFKINNKENKELALMNRFRKKEKKEFELKIFSESIFKLFSDYKHDAFLSDNISEKTMDKFEIKYDPFRHKIIIPHRFYLNNKLIGIKTRSLNEEEINAGYKYIPFKLNDIQYSYPTMKNLYGLYQNMNTIKKLGKIIIFEAEKSVLQCETYYPGNNFSVALSGSNLSKDQREILFNLGVKECIIALDKEYETMGTEEFKLYQEKIIRMSNFLLPYFNVSVVFDQENDLGYKQSPSDKGKEVLEKLMKMKQLVLPKE